MIIRLFSAAVRAVVADYGNTSLALMDDDDRYSHKAEAVMEATESKRTDATRPDAKPFRSVFVRASSEHMSKVMRLAKG